jgi:hypothetical protein
MTCAAIARQEHAALITVLCGHRRRGAGTTPRRPVGARLFLSARTVQYHLGNIFAKFGISSRSQLDRVLPSERAAV